MDELKPCPFCGGTVTLEEVESTRDPIYGVRHWWGVVCRNAINRGGTCAIEQRPSASKEAAIERWNRRAAVPTPEAVSVRRSDLDVAGELFGVKFTDEGCTHKCVELYTEDDEFWHLADRFDSFWLHDLQDVIARALLAARSAR